MARMPPRPPIPTDDLYARLEVPPDATFEAIEIAWRALLKRHHPDVAGHEGLELAKRMNVAHDWLSDAALRERYDRERPARARRRSPRRWDGPAPVRSAPHETVVRPSREPAAALRRFLDRVGRLSRDELDRLSLAETTSIAFVASIHRFLGPDRIRTLEAVEREIRSLLPPWAWASAPIRDAVLAAAHELVLGPFLDEHLEEPFRGRARDRLMRGWEAAVAQPRYGPNSALVGRFLERAASTSAEELRTLVSSARRARPADDAWPAGLDPTEDDGLRVSSVLAGRDAVAAAADALTGLDAATAARAGRLLARTAHGFVLRHAFGSAEFDRLIAPWRSATGEAGTERTADMRSEPRVRRR